MPRLKNVRNLAEFHACGARVGRRRLAQPEGRRRTWSTHMVRLGFLLLLVHITASAGCNRATTPAASPSPVPAAASWADEFDGPSNSPPDRFKWTPDLGGGGWGNQELQTYTDQTDNVHLDGQGHLIIRAVSTSTGFTSARLKTQGLFAAQYGRIETSVKLPIGRGIWPAFWMMGTSFNKSNWPDCGEIDIVEYIGSEPSVNRGTLHGPGYSGAGGISSIYTLPNGQKFSDAFHTFAIQWAPQVMTFSVDNVAYRTVTPASLPAGAKWVFDAPFFLLINVSVGGTLPGSPDASTAFPQEMVVDYVRYISLSASAGQAIPAPPD